MTKYLSEEASPEIRAAYQELMIAFYDAIMYEYGMLLKYESDAQIQEYVNSQTPKLVDLGMEYYGLIAKQDPEVAALIL